MSITVTLLTLTMLTWYTGFFLYSFLAKNREYGSGQGEKLKITVLIPFRNEKDNLERNFKALNEQSLSVEDFEVIYINDHSDDGGEDLIKNLISRSQGSFRLLELGDGKFSKKEALKTGIDNSNGGLIVTTDADSIVGPKWLEKISGHHQKSSSPFIIMPVSLRKGNSFLAAFQRLEFMSLQYVTRTFAFRGNPILCNGANLAFEKRLFYDLGGYEGNEHFASGDDFFLLMKMRKHDKKSISILDDKDVIAMIDPEKRWTAFLQQRIRWASKTKRAGSKLVFFIGIMNTLMALYLPVIYFLESALSAVTFPVLSNTFLAIKFIGDFLMLNQEKNSSNSLFTFSNFYLTFLLYPIYISFIFVATLFMSPTWKGRRIRH